jgi:hypothetical protein
MAEDARKNFCGRRDRFDHQPIPVSPPAPPDCLDKIVHVGHMTYMKTGTVISSRQFQQQFAKISKKLAPGETITVTNRGERIGTFTKARKGPLKVPDFYGNLLKLGGSKEIGQKMIDDIVNGLS